MYGSSRRKVSEQRQAVPKPKRVVKTTKAKVEANKRVVKEEDRKRKVRKGLFGRGEDIKMLVSDIDRFTLIPRTLTGQALADMTNKLRDWKKLHANKEMSFAQADRSFRRYARGPPKRAPPARPAPKRNGNGNGNGK